MSDDQSCTRRQVIRSLVGGSVLLPAFLSRLLAEDAARDPLAPRPPQFPGHAKRVIFLFLTGGVSHMDTFDHKPRLFSDDGKTMVAGGGLSQDKKQLLRPMWEFRPGGRCGTLVSDLFPHLRERMDDIALINSMKSDNNEHFEATLAMHTGSFTFARPSIGSWVSYGLGTLNQNLPSFMVIAPKLPFTGTQVFSNDFLPAYHQGTRVIPGPEPIPHLAPRSRGEGLQEAELGLAEAFDRNFLKDNGNDSELAARIRSFETAYRMQTEAPDAFDLRKESDETLKLYGLERSKPQGFAWQCLMARRLVERGVRFVELIDTGAYDNWDAHGDMKTCIPLAKNVDQPMAALLQDLKRRGMLDDTLVVWTTEFGRTPGQDGPTGRGHHSAVFSSWLAGGGTKGGIVYGKSDELASQVAEKQVHIHDFHATILHLLGFDHTKLTYRHAGRDFRLTDVYGTVVKDLLT
ncbi:MAG TPA: DUF1501 domain-containing protein [Planctomycetota bacterium]|nr:DUF1501 domain-containing protein [Planctomycetota bacterium]